MDSSENSLSSCTDEQLLLKIRSGESDGCEAQTLVKRYMSIVKLKAAKTAGHCPSADIDDLFSDGLMGLLKAIRYYNPEKERILHVKITDTNGVVYKEDDITFVKTPEKKTKRRNTSITTGSQTNAGSYIVTLTGEGIDKMLFEKLTIE